MDSMQHVIETVDSDAWFGDGVLYVVMKEGSVIDLGAAQMHVNKWKRFLSTREDIEIFALIVNMKGIKTITREARIFYSERKDERSKAVALIVGSAVSRIIANFFLAFTPNNKPVQLFTSKEAAFLWIQRFLQG